jgi:hypothetical protein
MNTDLRLVDHAALRTNQAMIIALLLVGFIFDIVALVPVVGLIMGIGTLIGRPGFIFVYRALERASLLEPDRIRDNPEPHRFAQGIGALVLGGSTVALLLRSAAIGWASTWVVILLAALNLFGGFCVGCALYYWLNRAGLPGFSKSPPPDTIPGRRPSTGDRGSHA